MPKPMISIAQVAGSGTAVGFGGMMTVAWSVVGKAKTRSMTMSFYGARFELNTNAVL